MRKIISAIVIFFGLFSFAAPALAGTVLSLYFSKDPYVHSVSPNVGERITLQGDLYYVPWYIFSITNISGATVTLWDVTGVPRAITNTTTNSKSWL